MRSLCATDVLYIIAIEIIFSSNIYFRKILQQNGIILETFYVEATVDKWF